MALPDCRIFIGMINLLTSSVRTRLSYKNQFSPDAIQRLPATSTGFKDPSEPLILLSMQQPLSPKKYIQTRVRKLPVYKCFVNKDWMNGSMADVFVMRRHVNGHITAGVYLIDLLCLGVKDTFFFFNEEESDIMARIPMHMFMEIDYPLAHNIIFAGYEFAAEYDIQPHKDFSITRHILEEDTDAVPLIEVATGDKAGKPLLMVDHPGQYSHALAKLKKHAGEGNYHFVVRGGLFDDDETDEPEEEDMQALISNYEHGEITALEATNISMAELMDDEQIDSRAPDEQVSLRIEAMLRMLRMVAPGVFPFNDLEELPELDRYLQAPADELNGYSGEGGIAEEERALRVRNRIADEATLASDNGRYAEKMAELVAEYAGDLRAIATIYDLLLVAEQMPAQEAAVRSMESFTGQYIYAKLQLALGALAMPDAIRGSYEYIYESADPGQAFPDCTAFHTDELFLYWLIKLMIALRSDDMPAALRYYALITITKGFSIQLLIAQAQLFDRLASELQKYMPDIAEEND
jgi:hypothetical protein